MTINLDFGVMANVNPVVITDFPTIAGLSEPQVIGGFLMTGWGVGSLTLSRYSGTLPTAGIMSIAITTELGSTQSGDNPIAAFMDASGNGYGLQVNGGDIAIYQYLAGIRQLGELGGSAAATFAAGAVIRLDIDLDTGLLTVFNGGVQAGAATASITTTNLAPTIGCDTTNASANGIVTADFEGIPLGINPVITDVNTTETVQVGDTPIVTGTSFLATGGTQSWGGVSVGFSSWADTSITSSAITRGDLAYNTNYDWVVTDNLAVASTAVSVQLAIETGFQFVTLSSPIIALVGGVRTSLCYGAVPDCVTGDQLRVPTTTDQGKAIDISAADGTFVITDAGNTEQTFSFEIWDADAATGDKWSASTAVVVNGAIVSAGLVRPMVKDIVRSLIH